MLNRYTYVFGWILILLGIFLMLFGRELIKPTLFILSSIFITLLILVFFYQFLSENETVWLFWLIFAISALIGIGVGIAAVCFVSWGILILGAAFGFFGSMLLLNAC